MRRIFLLVLVTCVFVSAQSAPKTNPSALTALKDAYWDFYLQENPELATVFGDYRYNDRLGDISLAHVPVSKRTCEDLLRKIKAVDPKTLSAEDRLDQQLLEFELGRLLDVIRLKLYEMPIDQFNGVQIQYPQIVDIVPLDSVKHYDDYIARLHAIPSRLDQSIELARLGAKDGLIPPKILLVQTVDQCARIANAAGEQSPFATPIQKIPAEFSDKEKSRIKQEILKAIDTEIRPAYVRLQKFIADEYVAKGRKDPGLWAMPNGDEIYRFNVRTMTTSDMTPEQIHQLGLSQVAAIEGEIEALAKKSGYPDSATFRKAIHESPQYKSRDAEQILERFRHYESQMEPKLPQLFGRLPKAKVVVVALPDYMNKEGETNYVPGTPDGSRPGQIRVKTYDPANHNVLDDEATAYHEGLPGHHLQISIAQELPEAHPFRKSVFVSAFAEGWALYSERIGKEVGFYQDPASDLGRLESELLRAIRLVEDTGVHYKRWTRQQMADYFQKHNGTILESEIDRYIAWPGQALAYKVGQLKILELRQRAETQLGSKFDIRGFHDVVVGEGDVPLFILEDRVNTWISQQKTNATQNTGTTSSSAAP